MNSNEDRYIFRHPLFDIPTESVNGAETVEDLMQAQGWPVRAYGIGGAVRICPPHEFDYVRQGEIYMKALRNTAEDMEVADHGPETNYPEYDL